MKRLLILVSLPWALMLSGCQAFASVPAACAIDPVDEILVLFDLYWNLGEDTETGCQILRAFREKPAYVLEALTVAAPEQLEQILILIGSSVANARRSDPAAYAKYARALQYAAELELNENAARILGFIHANIEHW
ncbi:MAG: hypothetical protein FWC64_12145 [Treponema sp.]|nr:hypothetical protein [Treponema sp.]